MKIIGITGGIGSGKFVVSQFLRVSGFEVYDTDTEAKKLMNTTEMHNILAKTFGNDILNGNTIDRRILASKVFGDKNALEKLNSLTHPMVRKDFISWVDGHRKQNIIFIESAILIEAGFSDIVDEIWLITAPIDTRIARIIRRNSCTEQDAQQRISSQSSDTTKAQYSHRVIVNDNKTPIIPQILEALAKNNKNNTTVS